MLERSEWTAPAARRSRGLSARTGRSRVGARGDPERVRAFTEEVLAAFPWRVAFEDWEGRRWSAGGDAAHWCGRDLEVRLGSPAAGRALLAADVLRLLDLYVEGGLGLEGNLYVLSDLRSHAKLRLSWWQALRALWSARPFQTPSRARANVRSHYDVPQAALDLYLDRVYRSYSCALFEDPDARDRAALLRAGRGREDAFDSLEKAQWRKFQDAIEFVAPAPGDTLLDIGCGYGGQLAVALESPAFGRVVGWTHSANQAREGASLLARFDPARWALREGDYRDDDGVYDHVTSTGMISHVGPRGLEPYVGAVRRRIRTGGRYLHHALMTPHTRLPLDLFPGTVFHKRYVWPGYHWFTLGQHVRALERNGFEVRAARNLSDHYARTTAAWNERLLERRGEAEALLGKPGLRAWLAYLAGSSGNFVNGGIHVFRLYCVAV